MIGAEQSLYSLKKRPGFFLANRNYGDIELRAIVHFRKSLNIGRGALAENPRAGCLRAFLRASS
jgi:hypothetical protein